LNIRKISSVSDVQISNNPGTQLTSKVLMIRPVQFGFNEETAGNNAFQKRGQLGEESKRSVQEIALKEFDSFVTLLESNGIEVIVVDDTVDSYTPDSIFPNNWFSTHSTGELVLYPMCAPNRRAERKEAPLARIKAQGAKGSMKRTVDLSGCETENLFLEGTGSMVLDRANGVAFVCRSPRSDESILDKFCTSLGYRYYYFDALDRSGSLIYHTNVMMCMGEKFLVVCLDSIRDKVERETFIGIVNKLKKEIVDISIKQMEKFAGNMLQLKNRDNESFLVMSATAKSSLTNDQLNVLEAHCKIIAPDITAIETNGGGSARCMIAELFF